MSTRPEAVLRTQHARENGCRVEWSRTPRTRDELLVFARDRGARQVWFSDGTTEVLE
jgi:hypothetical protein